MRTMAPRACRTTLCTASSKLPQSLIVLMRSLVRADTNVLHVFRGQSCNGTVGTLLREERPARMFLHWTHPRASRVGLLIVAGARSAVKAFDLMPSGQTVTPPL